MRGFVKTLHIDEEIIVGDNGARMFDKMVRLSNNLKYKYILYNLKIKGSCCLACSTCHMTCSNYTHPGKGVYMYTKKNYISDELNDSIG